MKNIGGPEVVSALARVPESMPPFQTFLAYLHQVKEAAGINREDLKFDNAFPPGFLAALTVASGLTYFHDHKDDGDATGSDDSVVAYDVKQLEELVAAVTEDGVFAPIGLFTLMGGKLKS